MKNTVRFSLAVFVISTLVAFVSTNVYWLLTVNYAKPIKKFGEKGVLTGFDAAKQLIAEYGVDAYLYGMASYFVVVFALCVIACLMRKHSTRKEIIAKQLVLGTVGSIIYYLLSIGVFVNDKVNEYSGSVGGYDVIHEVGYSWLVVHLVAVSFLFFVTTIVNTGLCRKLIK